MRCKVVRHRITIPTEFRNSANIKDGEYLGIYYDEKENHIVIDLNDRSKYKEEFSLNGKYELNSMYDNDVLGDLLNKVANDIKESKKSNIKIVANFEDAPKLYQTRFSECGLVVRTKTSYVNKFCEQCKGQLAKEWYDRLEVKCKYLEDKDKNTEKNQDEVIKNNNIEKSKLKSKKKSTTKPKKTKCHNENTEMQFVKLLFCCSKCGKQHNSGFLVDDDFMCVSCAKEDFKKFYNEYRKDKSDK